MEGASGSLATITEIEVVEQFWNPLDNVEDVWKRISEMQLVLSGLRGEQIKVSDKFCEYFEMATEMGQNITNTENLHLLAKGNEQIMQMSQNLEDFEEDLLKAEKIIRDLINGMREHFNRLRKWMEESNKNSQKPSLDWIQCFPDPQIEKLSEKWKEQRLELKITQCFNQVGALASNV